MLSEVRYHTISNYPVTSINLSPTVCGLQVALQHFIDATADDDDDNDETENDAFDFNNAGHNATHPANVAPMLTHSLREALRAQVPIHMSGGHRDDEDDGSAVVEASDYADQSVATPDNATHGVLND